MTDKTLEVAGTLSKTTYAVKFGKAGKASAAAVDATAKLFKEKGYKPGWIPDKYSDTNPVHLETFDQIATGRLTKRQYKLAIMTKVKAKDLSEKDKTKRDTARRIVRRLVMEFFTAVKEAMGGGKAQVADTTRNKKAEWTPQQRVMGGLLAMHDTLSGTDKVPATQFDLELQNALKPAIDLLRAKHGEAATVYNGFGQKYKGSFGVRKTK